MNRACAIVLFLVFTQYLIETTDGRCGHSGDPCEEDDQCCSNLVCVEEIEKCLMIEGEMSKFTLH